MKKLAEMFSLGQREKKKKRAINNFGCKRSGTIHGVFKSYTSPQTPALSAYTIHKDKPFSHILHQTISYLDERAAH